MRRLTPDSLRIPDQPLVPGATLLALMVDVARLVAPTIDRALQATFRAPVAPTHAVTIRVRRGPGARLMAEILAGAATPAATATLEAR